MPKQPTTPEMSTLVQLQDADKNLETITDEEIPAVRGDNERASVTVETGGTLRTGDFENVRYSVRVKLPCHADDASLERAYARADAFTSAKFQEQVVAVQAHVAKRRTDAAAAAKKHPFR
jgi:hypothetical protein